MKEVVLEKKNRRTWHAETEIGIYVVKKRLSFYAWRPGQIFPFVTHSKIGPIKSMILADVLMKTSSGDMGKAISNGKLRS